MSRVGKKAISIPTGVEVKIENNQVKVKGPKGELEQVIPSEILVSQKDNEITIEVKEETKQSKAFWGLTRALVQNMITGVSEGFVKQLEIVGVGYKAKTEGDKVLDLAMGYSHPVKLDIPEGLTIAIEKNIITVSGISKEQVGQFAAKIRDVRKPEPYKGKGIRYVGEEVRRKEGKKAATAT